MFRTRTVAAAAVLAGLGVLATPGSALAASCSGTHGFRAGPGTLTNEYFAEVNCDVAMTQITLIARLYQNDPVSGEDVLVGTGASTTNGSSHGSVETTPTLCVPAVYRGETDYTLVYPSGYTSTGTWTFGPITTVCLP